jgi:DNA-directed RNA polymerase subunit K/omega
MYPITKYEKTRILGVRATQLSNNAPSTVDITGLNDVMSIAMKEYNECKIPLTIERKLPNGQIHIIPLFKKD